MRVGVERAPPEESNREREREERQRAGSLSSPST